MTSIICPFCNRAVFVVGNPSVRILISGHKAIREWAIEALQEIGHLEQHAEQVEAAMTQ